MKHSKKIIAALLATSMIMGGALAGCNNNKPCTNHVDVNPADGKCDNCGADMPAPTVLDTDGRWYWSGGGFEVALKLKEDGTFYMHAFFTNVAGTWQLKSESKTYYKILEGNEPKDDAADKTQYTADKKLVLTCYDGTVYEGAYVDGKVYNLQNPNGYRTLSHEADYEWKDSDEEAVELLKVCTAKDANKSLVIYHNGTVADGVNTYVSGTWEKTSTGYDLKKDGTKYASVTTVADGKSTYTPVSGTAVTLYEEAWTPSYELKNEAADGDDVYSLKLWEDNTADLEKIDGETFASSTVVSGTWSVKDGVITPVLGEKVTNVADVDGVLTVTVKVSETETVDVSIQLADMYMGEASGLASYITVTGGGTKLLAKKDETYSLAVNVSVPQAGSGNLVYSGKYNAKTMEFEYVKTTKATENGQEDTLENKVAKPQFDAESGKVVVILESVEMDASAIVPTAKFVVPTTKVVLGDSWKWLALADYTATNTKAESANEMIALDGGNLFMKDGKFEVSMHATAPADMTVSLLKGTYTEADGVVTFNDAEDNTVATSAEGKVEFTAKFNYVNMTLAFNIANKTTVYSDVNGTTTPRQTAGTNFATIDKAYLSMKEGEFALTFDATAVIQGNAKLSGQSLLSGTYVENADGSYTFIVGENKYVLKGEDGKYKFTFGTEEEGYKLMGAFSVGVVTLIFDLG